MDCLRNIKQVVTIKNALTIISSFLVKMRSDKKLSAAKCENNLAKILVFRWFIICKNLLGYGIASICNFGCQYIFVVLISCRFICPTSLIAL